MKKRVVQFTTQTRKAQFFRLGKDDTLLIPLHSIPSANQSVRPPRVVQLLIITNIIVFGYQLYLHARGISVVSTYGAIPERITHVIPFFSMLPNIFHPSLITSLFLHDVELYQSGFLHIIGNMLYLSAFGPSLENRIGHTKFFLFYFLCGVAATLCHTVLHYNSSIPLIGASGAIAGVMGAHFVACPKSRIRCLLFIYIVSLPASIVLATWILLQLFNTYFFHQGALVAWLAHIAGFVAGAYFIQKFQPLPQPEPSKPAPPESVFHRLVPISPHRLTQRKRRSDV